jgi:N-acetylglutamate synthase
VSTSSHLSPAVKERIRALEALSLRAWPALETRYYDGWLLRFAEGYTRRANSINPVYAHSMNVQKKITLCEAIYAHKGITPCFKITGAVFPENLDTVLAARQYIRDAPTSVKTMSLSDFDRPMHRESRIHGWLSEDWLQDFARLNTVPHRQLHTIRQLLQCIIPVRCFMTLWQDGQTVAVGLGVLDGECIGLFDIVTHPDYRGSGYGTALVESLLHWGKVNGAREAYLQVMVDNLPARRLYERFGFREVYRYWYRRPT